MDAIISVQDIRTKLGSIAKRVEAGETFTVIRNSRPAFRLIPIERKTYPITSSEPKMLLHDIQEKFAANPVPHQEFSPLDLDQIIHEEHRNKRGV